MPKVNAVRYPRMFWAEAVSDGEGTQYPPFLNGQHPECYIKMPHNLVGISEVYVWFMLAEDFDSAFDFTLNVGTAGETPSNHSQTVNNKIVNGTSGNYVALDLSSDLSTVIATIQSNDIVWLITNDDDGMNGAIMGMELRESP